jgi:hypothetical protein
MMMAFNHDQTPAPALSDDTVAALRRALLSYLSDGDRAGALREALVLAAREARTKGIMAERLLVTLKATWNALPQVREADGDAARAQVALLQRVITRCIEEYYS